ncbi:MAG: sugar phosphate isomerase/epimerase [Tannerella sp.]|jgi:sugar phosphate isomerase/epimerase|nr:sugar phosphate isomerase/epimerase [Tannerella sp.]
MKKRHFLGLLFTVVSLSLCAQDLSERVGICTSIENASILKEAGCSYAEIGISGFFVPDRPDSAFVPNREKAATCVLPVSAGNIFFPGNLRLTGPDVDLEKTLAYVDVAMRRAQQTGTKIFVLGSGGSRRIPDGFDRETAVEQFTELCRRIALLGEKYGVTVVLEPLRKEETNLIHTVREGMEIVRAVNHPNLQVLADFYHMACAGEDAQALVEAGASLHHCHIAEKTGRTAPGVHGDDFTPYFKALKQINYRGSLSIECNWTRLEEQAASAVAEVKRQIRRVYDEDFK